MLNVLSMHQDTQPLLALPAVPGTLASQVESQVARLESKDDNDTDLLQARCGKHDRYGETVENSDRSRFPHVDHDKIYRSTIFR